MLELNSELLIHLESGGTLLVPSRQRATAVRLAYAAAMLAAGKRVWDSPDVLPWGAWLERALDGARARFEPLPRRLSSAEEWLLWRTVVREACGDYGVLMPDALIDPVRRAVGRMDDFGVSLPAATSAESAVLLGARAAFRLRCQELGALGTTSWQDCAAYLQPTDRVVLAGFSALGPQRRRWLQQRGVRVLGASEPAAATAATVTACEDPAGEARAAAQWCWARLEHDPQARLLLVVPRLAQQRHLFERALSQRLDFAALLSSGISAGDSLFAVEGGRPLISYPLVAAAIDLIGLLSGPVAFARFGALLRAPYFSAQERDGALRLELWLREHNIAEVSLPLLSALAAERSTELGAAAAPLRVLSTALSSMTEPAAVHVWGQGFADLLQRCGWPGATPLGSDEHQVRVRFDEVLGEFAAMGSLPGRLRAAEAVRLLHELTQRAVFEPATDDVPVTVTGSMDDPVVRYDGIWIAGLSADLWPAPAQPDPLLPPLAQQQAALPEATASGQLQLARQRLRQWRASTGRCVLSWSHSEAGVPNDPSPLLADAQPASVPDEALDLPLWIARQAPALEPWTDFHGPPVPPGTALRGGVRLLELQSLCPFRGFAELRLKARELPEPAPGIDARTRGQLLHAALERFWRLTSDSSALLAMNSEQTRQRVRECVQQAAAEQSARRPGGFGARLLAREAARAERLIATALEWERQREPFQVQAREAEASIGLAGMALTLRLDRIDRLSDGALAVIDYKSGTARRFDAFAERLSQPQLPAYALAAGASVCAVLMLHLERHRVVTRGLADRSGRVPRVRPSREGELAWAELRPRWAGQLQQLVSEYLAGYAAVQPLPEACAHCHLQLLCRVDPEVLEAAEFAVENMPESVDP